MKMGGGGGGGYEQLLFVVETEARLEAVRQARQELGAAATDMEVTGRAAAKMSAAIAMGAEAGSRALVDLARTIDITSAEEVRDLTANIGAVEALAQQYGMTSAAAANLANAEGVLAARLADAYGASGRAAVAAAAAAETSAAAAGKQAAAANAAGRAFDANNPKLRAAANAASMLSMAAVTGQGSLVGMTVAAGGLAQGLASMSTSATLAAGAAGIGALVTVLGILISLADKAGESVRGAGDIMVSLSRADTSAKTRELVDMTRSELVEAGREVAALHREGFTDAQNKVRDLMFPDEAQVRDRAAKLAQAYTAAVNQLNRQVDSETDAANKKRISDREAKDKAEAAKRAADAKTAEQMVQAARNTTLQTWLTERQRAVQAQAQAENALDTNRSARIQRTLEAETSASRFAEQAAVDRARATQERDSRAIAALHVSETRKQELRVAVERQTEAEITAAQEEGNRRRRAARIQAELEERQAAEARRSYMLETMGMQAEGTGNAGDIYEAKRRQIEEMAAIEKEAGEDEVAVEARKQARIRQLRNETAAAAKQNIISLEQILIASNSRQVRSIGNFISTLRRIELGYEAVKATINSLKEGAASVASAAAGDWRAAGLHALAALQYAAVAAQAGQESLGGGRSSAGGSGGGAGGSDRGTFEPRTGNAGNGGVVVNLITRDPYGRESIQQTMFELNRAQVLKRPAIEIPPTTGIRVAS